MTSCDAYDKYTDMRRVWQDSTQRQLDDVGDRVGLWVQEKVPLVF